jgi:tetratricopeptide (TPR) repeat protein
MTRRLFSCLWAVAVCVAACGESEVAVDADAAGKGDAARTRVVLFGVDGADLDIIMPLVEAGELPAFSRMLAEGAAGKLQTIQPILSPIIWTTIATGQPPDVHGILDFGVVDPERGSRRMTGTFDRRCEAIWDILGRHGRTVGIVGWMASHPPEPVNGFAISDDYGMLAYDNISREDDAPEDPVYPASFKKDCDGWRRKSQDISYEEVHAFLEVPEEEFRQSYKRRFTPTGRVNNLRLSLSTAESYRRCGIELYRREKPDFYACYFEFVDAISHWFMPYAPPRRNNVTEEDYVRYRGAVAGAYRYTDRKLAEMMDAADENTVILLVSDHGFRSGSLRLKEGSDFRDRAAARWHRPYGTFMAWGRGVRAGARITGATVFDVTPTILGLMGLPRAEDMRGKFLADAFEIEPPEETVETYECGRLDRLLERLETEGARLGGGESRMELFEALGYFGGGETLDSSRARVHLSTFLMSDDRPEEAEGELLRGLAAKPDDIRLNHFLATLYAMWANRTEGDEQQALVKKAAARFEKVTKLDPKQASAFVQLARASLSLGRKDEALEAAKRASEVDPENALNHLFYGKVLRRLGKAEEGEVEVRRAVDLEPDLPEARRMLGKVHLARLEFEKAVEHYRAAVELEPGLVSAWNELGVTYLRWAVTRTRQEPVLREERYDRAVEAFTHVIETWPDYHKAYLNRAQVRQFRGQFRMAMTDLETALRKKPDYEEARKLLLQIGRMAAKVRKK